jgi:hypothetical protein
MLSRRRLIDAATRLAAFVGLVGQPTHAAIDEGTFAAYVDTLIPDDESGPGALRLGVDAQLAGGADADYAAMIEELCRWLDERAKATGGRSFAALGGDERDAVVREAESSAPSSLPARAFRRTRQDAFALYYADARSWPGIGYRGPPQPDGFPDYAQPPREG